MAASNGLFRAAFIALFVLVISSTAALAREYAEFSPAPAPAPATMATGSAISLTLSMVLVSASLLLSLAGIIFN